MSNLYSMTGFGSVSTSHKDRIIKVEIRSLNGKQTDIRLKVPLEYREKEVELRNLALAQIRRGKSDMSVTILKNGVEEEYGINQHLFKRYHNVLDNLRVELQLPPDNLLGSILNIPNVIGVEESAYDDSEWEVILETSNQALKQLTEFRKHEGESLYNELLIRIKNIQQLQTEVQPFEAERTQRIREKMTRSLADLIDHDQVDQNRLEQELIYYLEKLDITEEKVRLKEHCIYFLSVMDSDDVEKGRKLGFIAQEIGREINTLGSKAQHAGLQRIVVQMKDELEKIKEQSFNIL